MSLSLALNSALSGLNVNQRSLQVLSQNITNANTAGYSRQVIGQAAVYLNGEGAGVSVDNVTRKASDLLQQAVRQKTSDVGTATVLKSYLTQAQVYYGQPGSTGSLDQSVQTFFGNLQNLAVSPESASAQQAAVASGGTLAQQVSALASGLENLRLQADQEIGSSVNTINTQLDTLRSINATLDRADALGQSTAGLLDQRDKALLTLSQYLNISVTYTQSGGVQVYAGNGIPLVANDRFALKYSPAPSVEVFTNESGTSALSVVKLDAAGNEVANGTPVELVTSGSSDKVVSHIGSGSLAGLLQLRDTILPASLAQLDNFAATLRDQMNAIQNSGSGFPGVSSMTATRLITATSGNDWSGSVRIAVLDSSGQPIASPYPDETGVRPLTLDLGKLDTGAGQGKPTVQGIIDAINDQFGAVQNKAELGVLNNVTMVSDSKFLPNTAQSFKFDFGLDNISGQNANFWVTGVTVKDAAGSTLSGAVTSTIPSFTLNPSNTYTTTNGTLDVDVKTLNPPVGLQDGDVVYLGNPGTSVNGLSATSLTGFFTVSNVSSSGFTIQANSTTAATGATPVAAVGTVTGFPKYVTAESGTNERTTDNGVFTANFTSSPFSSYYDISAQVATTDANGQLVNGTVTYRVYNNTSNLLNKRYSATAASGNATVVKPLANQSFLTATLVDATGKEIGKNSDGSYTDQQGYLKLATSDANYTIAIDELDSKEALTGRGFSHYFDLNDFFHSNVPTATGDTVRGSAIGLAVNAALVNSPGALTTGILTRSVQPTGANPQPVFTYHRVSGDNSLAQQFAALANAPVTFAATTGISGQSTSIVNYASQVVATAATAAENVNTQEDNTQALLDGFQNQLNSLTGVNLDEELANTVIYQNAYAATARIITVVDQMMQDLIGVFK